MPNTHTENHLPSPSLSALHSRLKNRQRAIKSFEAKANEDRTISEKIADVLTARLGSMAFLIANAIWFSAWILINTGTIPGIPAFDPFPFGLLTMIVSLEAIFLAIIVLISQNRASKIDDLREETDLQINTIAEEEITKIIQLQVLLLKRNGIDVSGDTELQHMLKPTDTGRIEKVLKKDLG